jgi:hypothetical protein
MRGDHRHGHMDDRLRRLKTLGLGALLLAAAIGWTGLASAQTAPAADPAPPPPAPAARAADPGTPAPGVQAPEPGKGILHLAATLTADGPAIRNGVIWRVFSTTSETDGSHKLVAQSKDAQPSLTLPNGNYVIHATFGFASAMAQVSVAGRVSSDRVNLNAGAIEVRGSLGNAPITPDKLSLSIYVPERGNSEAKLVVAGAKPGQIIRLPEGLYHVVSTYLDTVGVGSLTPATDTNSVVNADLRVQAGKLVEATVRHSAAVLTLKLVNAPGGEALANTSFTILTPGGDIIRDLIGAFPSLVLAEGDYLVIARHNGKTYQSEFKVQSALDRDVEVIAQSQP